MSRLEVERLSVSFGGASMKRAICTSNPVSVNKLSH